MKLIPVYYYGFTAMDRRFSSPMLPWIVSEIRKREYLEKLSVGVEDGSFQAYNADFELQFSHRVLKMTRFSQADLDPCTFLYLLRDDGDRLLFCYLFQAMKSSDVTDLYQQMKDQSHPMPTRSLSSAANLTSLCVDISPSSSNFFEVLYIGKIKVWNKKVPDTFIDDALEKFKIHEQEKRKLTERLKTDDNNLRRGSIDSTHSENSTSSSEVYQKTSFQLQDNRENIHTTERVKNSDVDDDKTTEIDKCNQGNAQLKDASKSGCGAILNSSVNGESSISSQKQEEFSKIGTTTITNINNSSSSSSSTSVIKSTQSNYNLNSKTSTVEHNLEKSTSLQNLLEKSSKSSNPQQSLDASKKYDSKNSSSSSIVAQTTSNNDNTKTQNPEQENQPPKSFSNAPGSVDIDDHNRTMVLQVDRSDLRLISPDRKVILMHKHHRDVTTCVQGLSSAEHFGFICREGANLTTYIGYVFKCESQSVASDAVQAITQAIMNAETRPLRPAITSCDHCPMVWYHRLCSEIEHLSDRKTQAAIFRRINQLDEEEQHTILTKFRGAETDSVREQNEFLMMLLRAHCEVKQGRHVHDTAENRSEFLNQYLGGSTIFMKAKRSLTNSFDHLLKRKASKDDFNPILHDMSLPLHSPNNREASPISPGVQEVSDRESEGTRSRTSTIGSQSDVHLSANEAHAQKPSVSPDKSVKSPMMDIFLKVGSSPRSAASEDSSPNLDGGSWRQAIFKRVATPSKTLEREQSKKRTKEELRQLWKNSIRQVILLARMDKENARLRAKQEENAVKRIKLEYDEMKPNQREVMDVWELVTNKESRIKCDNQMLLHAIRQGVPRSKRGEVWMFLAEQFCSRVAPIDPNKYPNYHVPYETWLKQLTSHQHAILIDLGRTFPSHSYYSSPMGPGQLALFNLLKAYSLLDPEVGYCQGLSFVAGVLLLHMEESHAFFLLRHLMFRRGLRKQYLPDMVGLQIKLYQLSRLLRDRLPELYNHFDFYEISPTLYAAPWLLTIFASQFPLGFVTRVFDLIFLENTDVIFRVALALLTYHKDKLLACDGFEEIMNYLKTKLPAIDKPTLDKIMKQVFTTDVAKQLNEYKVEYQVIQEEMISVQPQMDALKHLESQTKTLTEQNKSLMSQLELALSNVQRLEKTRAMQQAAVNRLESQNRAYEVTISTLGGFINDLMEQNLDNIEIPDDVRRIISNISRPRDFRQDSRTQNNLLRLLGRCESPEKPMVKSLSTGKITLPSQLDSSMTRSNSLNTAAGVQNFQKPQKISQFFSNSHSNILQRQQSSKNILNGAKIDIKIQEFDRNSEKSSLNESKISNFEKSGTESKTSPTHSVDSGISTPVSPKEIHPLSSCGEVSFTYSGTRELKNIKSLKNMTRNSSPDIMGK